MRTQVGPDRAGSTGIRKVIDIAKTSRRLFSIRALFPKLQLDEDFYSIFAILSLHRKRRCHGDMRAATVTKPRDFARPISVLRGKTNPRSIGCLSPEIGVDFYSLGIKVYKKPRVWRENRLVLGILR